jgi:GTPase SAR1 family protein
MKIPFRTEYIQKSWHESVLNWWNDWIMNGYKQKKPHLYLWGPSNTGKTTFVMNMLNQSFAFKSKTTTTLTARTYLDVQQFIFIPAVNERRFAWQQFDPNIHKCILIDEFNLNEYNAKQLIKVLNGETIFMNSKHMSNKIICVQVPVIIISNFQPAATIFKKYSSRIVSLHQVYSG